MLCGRAMTLLLYTEGAILSHFKAAVASSQRIPLPAIEKVVGGYYHSFAISRSGKLFSWACGNFGGLNDGQLGHGDCREGTDPEEVALPSMAASETVVDARAGCYHSAVLTSAGRVFTFGLNNYGQLGRSGLKQTDLVPRYQHSILSLAVSVSPSLVHAAAVVQLLFYHESCYESCYETHDNTITESIEARAEHTSLPPPPPSEQTPFWLYACTYG